MKRILASLTLGLALAGCGGDGGVSPNPAPRAGGLTLSVTTPNTGDGAVLLEIRGAPVSSVSSGTYQVYSASLDSTHTRVMVIGPLTSGAVATVQVPDVGRLGTYQIQVLQAADNATYAQRQLAGYSAALTQ